MVPFLSGLRVLGLSTIVSGVKATSLLADFGP
jgi:crotonobetainyl-CoA:carnitine CoA-transferase CaiB-like acyl-CoA transferase